MVNTCFPSENLLKSNFELFWLKYLASKAVYGVEIQRETSWKMQIFQPEYFWFAKKQLRILVLLLSEKYL